MLKMSSLISFICCYSFFYYFCRFQVIHSLNNFPLLLRACVSTISLPTEIYTSNDISIMTRAIKKWTTPHEISQQARFHHIHIFFLDLFLAFKRPKAPWTVSTTVRLSLWFFDLPWPGIYHLKNRHNKILSSKTCREQKT